MLKQTVHDWVASEQGALSDWHQQIFDFGETAWREYRSCAWYVERLRAEGFDVEESSGGMPTAFCATWNNGAGPTIGGYAEYDAVPGNCQAADTVERPRDGLSKHAGGHTDPHSALGIGSLGGFLAAKAAMEKHGIGLTIIDLLTDTELLNKAKAEFELRTGGELMQAPLCDYAPPIDFRWPEYVTDDRGRHRWWIPALPWEQTSGEA